MADAEIVATYELYNISRTKLENLIPRIFGSARLNIEIKNRFGQPVIPREWFLVPLFVINEAVDRIKDGTITAYTYDPTADALVQNREGPAESLRRVCVEAARLTSLISLAMGGDAWERLDYVGWGALHRRSIHRIVKF
jgi:hypothetical protein